MEVKLILAIVSFIILFVIYGSLIFRLSYWRQKALNRMDDKEANQAKKTGDGFFAFLR